MMDAACVCVRAGVPVLIWGAPGTGKTSAIKAMARSLGMPVEVIIASIREPSDFGGLPIIVDGTVRLAEPSWARRLSHGGMLFIDEITTAAPAVQAALLRVILDRVVGDCELPPSVSMVAAANPPEQAAGGWDLAAPLANRFCHLTWSPTVASWCEGITGGWSTQVVALDDGIRRWWQENISYWASVVAGFIRRRPDLLLSVPDNATKAGRAWPSPRTWDMAIRLMAASNTISGPREESIRQELVCGCVGDGAGMELLAWIDANDLPAPGVLLESPETAELPASEDALFATCSALVSALKDAINIGDLWLPAWTIMARVAAIAPDIAATSAHRLANLNADGKLPIPHKQMSAFLPMLQSAGVVPGGAK